ncbi:MAG: 16S rRNA (cytosine(1402)-N(4))-methyltransferase RsmH [Thermoanaerobaculia bacterium]|nr:16S rRNA (cytosine(1402)-N(4))-methyltransferase RsmH [Thermoanaerobaculia bacterium]
MAHEPVLVDECLHWLQPERGGWFVDCTVGPGGHAERLLERAPGARLVAIDRDPAALELARARLGCFGDRVRWARGDFRELPARLAEAGLPGVGLAGVLADLGVSSLQLDTPERGFSFRFEGPLDMRMGPGGMTAREIVNDYPEGELERIFREYGEERQARRIARAVVKRRAEKPIQTTRELRDLVHRLRSPRPGRRIDPATRVFQALRIEVNRELDGLDRFLRQAIEMLDREGRLVVLSYHSLEDRIVKHTLRGLDRGEVDEVTGRPRSETRLIEVLTRKPVRPGATELIANPRSRSARLRAARRI